MEHFPVLHTDRLVLRKLQVEDIPLLVRYANNKKITDYILNFPFPYQEPDAVFRIRYVNDGFKANTRFVFSIVLKDTGEFVGEVCLHLDDRRKISQLAYWIGEPFWRKGIVTEAIRRVLVFGFRDLQLDLIFASCDKENVASIMVLEKNHIKRTHATGNILQYAIRREDFEAME